MNIVDRIRLLSTLEKINFNELSRRTGIDRKRIENIINKKAKVRHEDIELLGHAWPEYRYWIAYGEELPESGQISPITKANRGE